MSIDEAKEQGAMALFEDKYDDIVRVVTIGPSIELCGGTHVKNTDEIGNFAILKLENKGSDVYRIEGATGNNIKKQLDEIIKPYTDEISKLLSKSKELIRSAKKEKVEYYFDFDMEHQVLDSYEDVVYYKDQLERLKISVKKLQKTIDEGITNKSLDNVDELLKIKKRINNIDVIIATTKNYEVPILKQLVDNITNTLDNSFVLLANLNDNSVNIICKTNIDSDKIHCGNIVKDICQKCEGNGGGNKLFAQGGGSNAKNIKKYLNELKELIKEV
jgi:alanyl-tRNA synthetase